MNHEVTVTVKASEFPGLPERIKVFARAALGKAAIVVRDNVRDKTPRWRGGLVRGVQAEARMGGDEQAVFSTGVVANVHEYNAHWSTHPPFRPLLQWVTGKLGLSGKEARSVAFAVRHKIYVYGLTLPNVEGRGKMYARTFQLMQASGFHMMAFTAALRNYLGGR